METPTSLLVIVVIAVVVTIVGFVRAAAQLRRLGPGPEREALRNSLWSMGGSAAIILSIAMGLPPLSLSLGPRMLVLAGAVGLVVTASGKSRRLREARQHELLRAGATATNLADRVEALEGQRLQYRRIPVRVHLALIGGKAVMAGSAFWAMHVIKQGPPLLVFGTVAVTATAWLGWDLFNMFRRKAGRERIDAEIENLLGSTGTGGPDARRDLPLRSKDSGVPPQ